LTLSRPARHPRDRADHTCGSTKIRSRPTAVGETVIGLSRRRVRMVWALLGDPLSPSRCPPRVGTQR